ncbi:hypothetical protein A3H89_03360 [Candidatus Amesbacteria bacterium RIFCSPLOWO2_02_FULL_48_11]|uniref:Phosphoribosyl transferase domain protein n=2 Tax=Candidatus Amesiibacteriota TaxID=1752730 RepID=A0A0G1WVK0_9BACT|nr:MAG: Phosphoribosyl transferase domain protein [Candidatus Amesbacteria bacterium GW2011_GWC1_48_10]KKU99494.1 MAG: Phosphoribosyl transferase domain protein [Candidatus Amesbacteria bacterium GW2011_GWA1_48_9]OGC90938.1 MAG: hypothetical protein A2V48_02205 [Candidatus Amesbacteria bacterium RBG_19FT_COMBO_48_16]OGC96607.1 MAG: hypothetical protein A3C34_00690 [Candidatus Amesbacteria bacterium RIFCSPHIGHO2_02_FULL_48_21]OGC97371.1 MAG: hypothetical protein A2W16_00625 [Candidatus Amesbacte
MQWFDIEVCGLRRRLPIVSMGPKLKVASVSLLGDVELVKAAARELVSRIDGLHPEVLIGPETKVVPLLQVMSELMRLQRYVVCRKGIQAYMVDPAVVVPGELRNRRVREMAIDGQDAKYLGGKRTVIVDDVVFTGSSFRMVGQLLLKVGAVNCGLAAVFRQGGEFGEKMEYLYELPVF